MKHFSLLLVLVFSVSSTFGEDSVDEIDQEYKKLAAEGLLKLKERNVTELEAVKQSAMSDGNLALATKADQGIKALQTEMIGLQTTLEEIKGGVTSLPENEFYKMNYTSGKTGTEKGAKIFCNFERLPLTEFAGNKLSLVITASSGKDAETAHQIFVYDETTGKEVGMTSALGRGKTKKIPLALPPSETLKLAVAVKGGDALHLNQFEKGVPELYLEIEK